MFKANVGLSRKITRDYNSTGYTVNVEGEITAPLDQPAAVLQQIKGLFKLAEDALAQEIDRDQGQDAQGRRDEEPRRPEGNGAAPARQSQSAERTQPPANRSGNGQPEPASDKQVRYLQSLAKRQKMSPAQLEDQIARVLGNRLTLNGLTKKEAGRVIDSLTDAPATDRR